MESILSATIASFSAWTKTYAPSVSLSPSQFLETGTLQFNQIIDLRIRTRRLLWDLISSTSLRSRNVGHTEGTIMEVILQHYGPQGDSVSCSIPFAENYHRGMKLLHKRLDPILQSPVQANSQLSSTDVFVRQCCTDLLALEDAAAKFHSAHSSSSSSAAAAAEPLALAVARCYGRYFVAFDRHAAPHTASFDTLTSPSGSLSALFKSRLATLGCRHCTLSVTTSAAESVSLVAVVWFNPAVAKFHAAGSPGIPGPRDVPSRCRANRQTYLGALEVELCIAWFQDGKPFRPAVYSAEGVVETAATTVPESAEGHLDALAIRHPLYLTGIPVMLGSKMCPIGRLVAVVDEVATGVGARLEEVRSPSKKDRSKGRNKRTRSNSEGTYKTPSGVQLTSYSEGGSDAEAGAADWAAAHVGAASLVSSALMTAIGEDPFEPGGYFIASGHEKVFRMITAQRANHPFALERGSFGKLSALPLSSKAIVIRSLHHSMQGNGTANVVLLQKVSSAPVLSCGRGIMLPLVVVLRALVDLTDKGLFDMLCSSGISDSGPNGASLTAIRQQRSLDVVRGAVSEYGALPASRTAWAHLLSTEIRQHFRMQLPMCLNPQVSPLLVVQSFFRQYVLPHLNNVNLELPYPQHLDMNDPRWVAECRDKAALLKVMIAKLYDFNDGLVSQDDPDSPSYQEVFAAGDILFESLGLVSNTIAGFAHSVLLKNATKMTRTPPPDGHRAASFLQMQLSAAFAPFHPAFVRQTVAKYPPRTHWSAMAEFKNLNRFTIQMSQIVATGNFKFPVGAQVTVPQTAGLVVPCDRINLYRFLAQLRTLYRGSRVAEMRSADARMLSPDAWGFVCPIHTPDGAPCGVLNHLAAGALVSTSRSEKQYQADMDTICVALLLLGMQPVDSTLDNALPVLLDGKVLGQIHATSLENDPSMAAKGKYSIGVQLRSLKKSVAPHAGRGGRTAAASIYGACSRTRYDFEISLPSDSPYPSLPADLEIAEIPQRVHSWREDDGWVQTLPPAPGLYLFLRSSRLMRSVAQRARLVPEIKDSAATAIRSEDGIQLVGALEQTFMHISIRETQNSIAPLGSLLKSDLAYTHTELAPAAILSYLAQCTPFFEMNPSARNLFQIQMSKQTLGVPTFAMPHRSDNKMYVLTTPQAPLVMTQTFASGPFDEIPHTTNAIVAVIAYTTMDMEDAVILNNAAIQRGLFHGVVFKSVLLNPGLATTAANSSSSRGTTKILDDAVNAVKASGREDEESAASEGEDNMAQLDYGQHEKDDDELSKDGSGQASDAESIDAEADAALEEAEDIPTSLTVSDRKISVVFYGSGEPLEDGVFVAGNDGLPTIGSRVKDSTVVATFCLKIGMGPSAEYVPVDPHNERFRDLKEDQLVPSVVSASSKGRMKFKAQYGMAARVHAVVPVGRDADGSVTILRVTYRIDRTPLVGDKFSSRHGQKGTVSLLYRDVDMPFTASGMVPDLIINPHAFPSRMTIGMFLEILAAKTAALTGSVTPSPVSAWEMALTQGDDADDAFSSKESHKQFAEGLRARGFDVLGHEEMYSGTTGELLECDVFMGPVAYQRLRHMVSDKWQARELQGAVDPLTLQSVGGRSRQGGGKFGEMEKDCVLAHGAPNLLLDRQMTVGNATRVLVCQSCGLFTGVDETTGNRMLRPVAHSPTDRRRWAVAKGASIDTADHDAAVDISIKTLHGKRSLRVEDRTECHHLPRVTCSNCNSSKLAFMIVPYTLKMLAMELLAAGILMTAETEPVRNN